MTRSGDTCRALAYGSQDAQHMQRHLPRSLLAVFYTSESSRGKAASTHGWFLHAFNLTSIEFPLVSLSLAEGFKQG